jgi:hypothetical protein
MSKPTIKIHNATTGEVIEREMNKEELAQLQIDAANEATKLAAAEAKAEAKTALLEKLGITKDEAKLLLG